ncbi:MAG: LytR C-terminal domain-containing protein [Actinobacteria bacterium]|nr:LytR C-terminal domain-containing protein [Actinomycetota bacterium]
MEHSLPQVRSPWRTATLVASTVAAAELVILVVLGFALLAEPVSQRVRQTAEAKVLAPVTPRPRAAVPAGKPRLSRAETSVIVLNGSGRSGAAAEGAVSVSGLGYTIGTVGNAPRGDFARTIVMFRPGYRAEAVRLAADLKLKLVGPLDGLRTSDLLGAHLALILGS